MFPIDCYQFYAILFNLQQQLPNLHQNKVQKQQEVKQEEGVEQKEIIKKKDECENQQNCEKKGNQDKENENDFNKIHIYPGQSKNYYKNMGQKIVKFIFEYFEEDEKVMSDTHIKQFIKIGSQGFNRNAILKLKKSRIARKILKLFFANYKWVKPFISQHKAELDLYFRYNTQVYCPQKQKKSQKLRNEQIKQEE